jgi:hypothetical protein
VVTALAMEVQVLTERYAAENCIGLIGRMKWTERRFWKTLLPV